jgi:bifunctional non-homologous end joining protein LigD
MAVEAKTARKAKRAVSPKKSDAKGDLTRYRDMRDFSKTPEPSGQLAPAAGDLRFVIQKHAARRLHYDLRLELDGVYKSWAVARGPSLDAQEKRLAIHVEDHPIDYGDFEGIIPKGEYGGGTVMIWDRGFWRPEGDPGKGYGKGHLAFELFGEKLHGRWHLIRTRGRPGEKKEQWLLFKSDDEYARPAAEEDILEKEPDSVATHRTMDEIAAGREAVWSTHGGLVKGDLSPPGAGAADADQETRRSRPTASKIPAPASVVGAKKGTFPGFVEPCLAVLVEKPPDADGWLHEIKFDGYRLMASISDGRVTLRTRSGLDWTERFPGIAGAFQTMNVQSAIVDGEAVIEDANGVTSFSALQDALSDRKPASTAVFFAFDLLYLNGYDLRKASLDDRKAVLSALVRANAESALRYSDHMIGNGRAMLDHACRLGLEGVVSKRRNAPYRSGRHGEWLKCKCTNREEFVIGGYVPSTASRNAVGSLALGYYDRGRLIYAGRTGTGFTQKSSQAIFRDLQALRLDRSPFANRLSAEEMRGLLHVEPRLVAQVEFRGWTADGRLRHAAFKGLREDKLAAEVQLEIPQGRSIGDGEAPTSPAPDRKREKPMSGQAAGRSSSVAFAGVTLTHPDRILWNAAGLTKLGLAEYYASVADRILPHIVERPLALVRCPNGIEGECFFQKHAFAGLTDAVEVARVRDGDGEAETLVIHDLRGLITLVQANVLEIHPWGARLEDTEHPDTLIFDLDPGEGVDWGAVIEGARNIRRRLNAVGLESHVKTSGGKGLHVVSHLVPSIGWDELKSFAHDIALAMEQDEPSKYLSSMAKNARGGKIFVDYLRNGRGATAVASYSTRARPGAPISTPVRWEELGPALTPARFTVANIGRRLAALKSDPWEGFFSSPQRIDLALAALKKIKMPGSRVSRSR